MIYKLLFCGLPTFQEGFFALVNRQKGYYIAYAITIDTFVKEIIEICFKFRDQIAYSQYIHQMMW